MVRVQAEIQKRQEIERLFQLWGISEVFFRERGELARESGKMRLLSEEEKDGGPVGLPVVEALDKRVGRFDRDQKIETESRCPRQIFGDTGDRQIDRTPEGQDLADQRCRPTHTLLPQATEA